MMAATGDLDGLVERLGQLVSIETPSGDEAGLSRAMELLRSWFDPILGRGTDVTRDGVPHMMWRPAGRPAVLLLGHVDTVWPLGTIRERPFAVRGERAVGPGVFDMKAGLVIALEALRMVQDSSRVALLVTGDEEVGSVSSRPLIEEVAADCAVVLVLEPSLDGAVKTARKGAALYQVDVRGRAAHAGLEPELGANALIELAHLVLEIAGWGDADRGTTVTPTVAQAGAAVNAVPAHADLRVDVRAWDADELDRIHTAMRSLRSHDEDVEVHVGGAINRYPMELATSRSLLDLARTASAECGLGPVSEARAGGASDGNFTAALGVPTLDGLGAVGGGAHADHEWVEVSSLGGRAALVARMIEGLTR